MRPDPARQFANSYAYAGNGMNPIIGIDLFGLELRVYSSPAWQIKGTDFGMNHVFVYSTELEQGIGRSGAYGKPGDDAGWMTHQGNLESLPYVVVSDLNGMTEEEAFRKLEEYPGWNEGGYFFYADDCHTQLKEAFAYAGLDYPGTPSDSKGRIDWDDKAEWLGWVLGFSEIGWLLESIFGEPQIYRAGHIIWKNPIQIEGVYGRDRHTTVTVSSQSRKDGSTVEVDLSGRRQP